MKRLLCFLKLASLVGSLLVLASCGGGGGSGSQSSVGTSTQMAVIASGTVDSLGGTINDTLGETAVIVQPGSLSDSATITIERGRDASGNLVTTFSTSSPTAIPADIVLPSADVLENSTPGGSTAMVAGLMTAAECFADSTLYPIQYPCGQTTGKRKSFFGSFCTETDANGGINDSLNGQVKAGWFRTCAGFWRTRGGIADQRTPTAPAGTIVSTSINSAGLHRVDQAASVLSSECSFENTSCYVNKQPVLFIHGYLPLIASENGFGGGIDTFGQFPSVMHENGYVTFEFRWVTAAKFKDVAADLGRAIEQIATRTGKKVHVIAHSFGGVLARTYLQGLASNYPYKENVATLTTIGSPHSGIFDGDVPHKNIMYRRGQDTQGGWLDGEARINACDQLSCYQLGEPDDDIKQEAKLYGVDENGPGEMAVNLFETRHLLPDVPIQILIGLTTSRGNNGAFDLDEGDGLISYQGQRFLPTYTNSTGRVEPLRSSFLLGKATITEKILGTNSDVQPNDANPFSLDERVGYRHSLLPVHPIDANPMVNVENRDKLGPSFQPTVTRRTHSAVDNAKQWVLDHPSAAATSVLQFTFRVTVADNVTSLPLGNVSLLFSRNGVDMVSGKTDTTGAYSFNLDFHPDSVYAVKIFKSGYAPTIKTITTTSTPTTIAGISERLNPVVGSVAPIIHALNIIKSGDGMVVGGVNCSPVCKASFKEGDLVMLFAQAYQGASFSGWIGCDNEYLTAFGPRCDVTMSSNKVVSAAFTLVTGATPVTTTPALSITTTSLTSVAVGTGYAQGVAVSGGQTPYTWSVSSGLPSGLNINSTTGAIYGYPSVSGTFNFTVTARDSNNPQKVASQALSLTVTGTAATPALSITTTAFNPATATVGTGYAAQQAVAATGGQTPYSCSASGLPTGMSMNASSCAVYGTPTVSGTFNATVTVTDSSSPQKTASKILSLSVATGVTAPTVTLSASPSSIANGATSTLNWSSTNSTSCTSTGGGGTGTAGSFTTPPLTSTTTYTVICAGSGGGAAQQSATVTVAAPASPPTAPSGLAVSLAPNFISLAWNDNSSNETGFTVERKSDASGSWSQIANTGQNVAAYRDYGVSAGVMYYYRVSALNASGGSGYSNEIIAIIASSATAPTVQSSAATPVTSTSAQMNGTVNPNGLSTSAYFEYGTTTSYGSTTGPTTISGTSATGIQSVWSGLTPNTTYHYRVVAANSSGTNRGGDVAFTTPASPLAVNGVASSYTGTGQKTIPLSGSGFSSITQISWSCTMPSGTSCTGSPYVWTPGTTRWNNVTIASDTVAYVYPTFLVATDPPGTYNWSVTFSGGGQSVIRSFTVTK